MNSFGASDISATILPGDDISNIQFHPQQDMLAVAAWDNSISVYDVQPNQINPKVQTKLTSTPLDIEWIGENMIASANSDGTIQIYNAVANTTNTIGKHEAGARSVHLASENIIVSGGWDKAIRYWDIRSNQPIGQVALSERIYCMDAFNQVVVAATADKNIHVLHMGNPMQVFKTMQSTLKLQSRSIAVYRPNPNGFALGSIEGRCALEYFEDKDQSMKFSFKCHREDTKNIYAVNAIRFHPNFGTFTTAGSDGCFHFWDKESKQRLKANTSKGLPITCNYYLLSCFVQ
eukprot:NODE_316_length_9983_cov_1.089741.p5 type:complete len:290 gc:universal NODE_316_length_9983_cov_1.089741:3411-4280(+)